MYVLTDNFSIMKYMISTISISQVSHAQSMQDDTENMV